MTRLTFFLFLFFVNVAFACVGQKSPSRFAYVTRELSVDGSRMRLRMPEGFIVEVLSTNLDAPRLLTFGSNGDLFIGSHSGNVYRVPPPYTAPELLVSPGGYPHSVAFRKNEILIAVTDAVLHAPYQSGQAKISLSSLKVLARLPAGDGHNSRTVAVGPDGLVYLSLGIQGNCSDQYLDDKRPFIDRRGGVMVLREDTGNVHWEPFASGLRNPVGFDWQPSTGAMYASNNGPDHLGFDRPPEYLSRITAHSFHGMPWFQFDGKEMQRDYCVRSEPPRPGTDAVRPAITFPARSAPLGIVFVRPGALDGSLDGDVIVALHGSWGTSPKGDAGGDRATRRPPKIVAVRFMGMEPRRVDDLVTGFQLANGDRWARPAGVAIGPDGALYFTSDNYTNGLFRLKKLAR